MPRIRSVKPEFWVDRSFVRKVPDRTTRMLYMALWNLADEHGRLMGDVSYLKGHVFPYPEDADLTPAVIDEMLDHLADVGKVVRYEADGDDYLFLPTLHRHQRLEANKVPSRIPAPPGFNGGPRGGGGKMTDALGAESAQLRLAFDDRADESAYGADEYEPGADESSLFYGAWDMEHGSFSSEASPLDENPGEDLATVYEFPGGEVVPEPAEEPKPKRGRPKIADIPRPDAEALCNRLADLMIGNGCKPPEITKKWRDAARLLLDTDKREFDKAMRLIEWCQKDEFWRTNILSMPTFRRQYEQLRLKANAEWKRGNVPRQRADNDLGTPAHMARFRERQESLAAAGMAQAAPKPELEVFPWSRSS